MKILSLIQQFNFYQAKIKTDTEKLKYYLIINDKTEANKIIDEILQAKDEIKRILDIKV